MGAGMTWCRVTSDELAGGLPMISAISGEPAQTTLRMNVRDQRARGSGARVEIPITTEEAAVMRRHTTFAGICAISVVGAFLLLTAELRDLFTVHWSIIAALGVVALVAGVVAVTLPHCGARMYKGRVEVYVCPAFRDAVEMRRIEGSSSRSASPPGSLAPLGSFAPLPPSFADAEIEKARDRRRRLIPLAIVAVSVVGVISYLLVRPDTASPAEARGGMCIQRPDSSASEFELADCEDEHFGEVAGVSKVTPELVADMMKRVDDPSLPEPDRCGSIVRDYVGPASNVALRVVTYVSSRAYNGLPIANPDKICVAAARNGSMLHTRVGRR